MRCKDCVWWDEYEPPAYCRIGLELNTERDTKCPIDCRRRARLQEQIGPYDGPPDTWEDMLATEG